MVRVQIRDHLKAAIEGDDLALDMFLQYPTRNARRIRFQRTTSNMSAKRRVTSACKKKKDDGYARQQPYPDFLIKHFENFSARAALEQFAVHFEAPDRFATAFGRTEIERGIVGWVVCPGLGQRLNDVIDLSWYERTVRCRQSHADGSCASVLDEPGS